MTEEFNNIDQLFNDELKGFAPEVPEGAWKNIASNLPAKSKKRVLVPFFKIAAGIAIVLSSGIAFSLLLKTEKNKQHVPVANVILDGAESENPQKTESTGFTTSNNSRIANNEKQVVRQNKNHTPQLTAHEVNDKNNSSVIANKKQLDTYKPVSNTISKRKKFANTHNNTTRSKYTRETPHALSKEKTSTKRNKNGELRPKIELAPATGIVAEIAHNTSEESFSLEQPEYNNNQIIMAEDFVYNEVDIADKEPRHYRWIIGGSGGPQYSDRNLAPESVTPEIAKELDKLEDGIFAYASGINVEFAPTRRLRFQSGINFSKIGQEKSATVAMNNSEFRPRRPGKRKFNDNISVDLSQNSTGNIKLHASQKGVRQTAINQFEIDQPLNTANYEIIDGENEVLVNQYFEYLEVPLIAKYTLIDKTIDVHVLGGVSANMLIGNYVNINSQDQSIAYTEGAAKLNYSSTVGFGINYNLSKRLNLSLEPQVKYYLNSQIENHPIRVHPYTFGIMSGVQYLF